MKTITGQIQIELKDSITVEDISNLAIFVKEGLDILTKSLEYHGYVRHETYINNEVFNG